ncbi:thiol reductant ABC exporter subunit CydD [Brachybacterium sp. EF45031]|uniref:thiol reductant ABC exporter subunit CydD n=1 Tax=Brachybacterium sillae TaxID=2810536 RepID=UPI00217E4F61|nr:thiol reductant ABC exporter subunit CydD [Brachybacterium sillae]MCS6710836.1 thiol reductant ABC exporter subunit CydD [Brachybacterium sillae]
MTDTPVTSRGRRRPAPIDPRLVRHVRAARGHLALTVGLGLLQAVCVILTAVLLARIGADLLVDGVLPSAQPAVLLALLGVLMVRAGAVFLQQRTGHRAATAAVAELRRDVVEHAALLGPRAGAGRGGDLATLATTGLELLRPYLVGYVPQLVLAATVTPLALVAITLLDLTSGLIVLGTLPLVPIFMILIGLLTQGRSERLLADQRRLWAQTLDLVDGLPTLRALGRERGPERTVHDLGDRHRRSTMDTLRVAFLSSTVLELLATLCVALVAVAIGMRLVYGQMELFPALAVLVLAPEAYLPLRQVGQQFHASTDGLAALDAVFTVLEEPAPADGTLPAPDLRRCTLRLRGVGVRSRDGGHAPDRLDLEVPPGHSLALIGPSGAGKTTAVHVLLGLLQPDEGHAEVIPAGGDAVDVTALQRRTYWDQIVHLPQRPVLPPGPLRDVLREARPEASDAELDEALSAVGLDTMLAAREEEPVLGRDGSGASLGERQRLALARAVLSSAPVVILDEPTAHLDGASEELVVGLMRRWSAEGRTVLVVTHRGRTAAAARTIVEVTR